MKIKITMKDPDAVADAVRDAIKEDVDNMVGLSNEERLAVFEIRKENTLNKVCKWFEHGEYLTVKVDTEVDTCVVIKED